MKKDKSKPVVTQNVKSQAEANRQARSESIQKAHKQALKGAKFE
jgi:hypothetical protein